MKIKVTLPEKFLFSTVIPIRIGDINYGGHLGNDSVLSLVHEARVRFLQSMDYSEMDIEGNGIIMVDAAIQFKSEGFYGDVIKIEIGIDDMTNTGCDIIYSLSNNESGKVIAAVKTGMVFYDYNKRKILPVPEKFIESIKTQE
jgi:acyl-CoA thioesterase FadM